MTNPMSDGKIELQFSNSAENIVGKEENAGFQHFLLFPHCFRKFSFPESLKPGII